MAASCKPKLLVVAGPTATGKTALSVHLAKRFGGEIVSADSMQLYRGLDIGTAKATAQERQGVPHYLLDIADPSEAWSVAAYVQRAREAVEDILARGHVPLVVGGTGLYIRSLLSGLAFAPEEEGGEVRSRLAARLAAEGAGALYEELRQRDPAAAAAIHPHNTRRVLRALEVTLSGRPMSEVQREARAGEAPWDPLSFVLTAEPRKELYARIDRRLDAMVDGGLVEEARRVYENRLCWRTAAQAIGYKELFPFFAGEAALEPCVAALKTATHRYAKRQLTWFRRDAGAVWLNVLEAGFADRAVAMAQTFLERGERA